MKKVTEKYLLFNGEDGDLQAKPNPTYWKEISKQKYDLLLKKSNIPDFYHDIEFSDYQGELSRENLNKCIYYSQHCFEEKFNHVHLYLYGGNSSQKTAIMCNIGKELIKQGKQVKFILSSVLLNNLMKLQGFNTNEECSDYIQSIKRADIILVDDVFAIDKNLQWKNNTLITTEWDSFFRDLFVSDKKIIMTSNISVDIVRKEYGESLFELIDRNCIQLNFVDSIKVFKKSLSKDLFKDM